MIGKKKVLQIEVIDEGVLHYGQRVYVVIETNYKEFREKCPICDDTKKVMIKGMEFACPYCTNFGRNNSSTSITIYNYVPEEYIINVMKIEGEEVRGAYKRDGSPADGRYPSVSYSGFAKHGNGNYSAKTKTFCAYNFEPHDAEKVSLQRNISREYCFLCERDAKAFIKRLHERQKELLDNFNSIYGTEHPYPFEY